MAPAMRGIGASLEARYARGVNPRSSPLWFASQPQSAMAQLGDGGCGVASRGLAASATSVPFPHNLRSAAAFLFPALNLFETSCLSGLVHLLPAPRLQTRLSFLSLA